jgi:hypothetical protein
MDWTCQALLAALIANDDASRACRAALRAGARFDPPSDRVVPRSHLAAIYQRRKQRLDNREIMTVNIDGVLDVLRTDGSDVRIGGVHSDAWNFQLFLDATEPVSIACLAVDVTVAGGWSADSR